MMKLTFLLMIATFSGVAAAQTSLTPLEVEQWPAGVADRGQLPIDQGLDYTFSDIDVDDIEAWLRWLDIALPVDVSGNISGWVWGQRSAAGWFNFESYRVEGEISSPALKVDQWLVQSASVRFGYADGSWYVGKLQGQIDSPTEQTVGQAEVAAKVSAGEEPLLEMAGAFSNIQLGLLLAGFGVDIPLENRGGELQFSGTAPMAAIGKLESWKATAKLDLLDVTLSEFVPANLIASAELTDGQWKLTNSTIRWDEDSVPLAGDGRLDSDFPFRFATVGNQLDMAAVLIKFGQPELASQLAGRIDFQASVEGDRMQGIAKATAQIASLQLQYRNQTVSDLQLTAGYLPTGIKLEIDEAAIAKGRLSGALAWRNIAELTQGLPSNAMLHLTQIDLQALDSELIPLALSGSASGEVGLQSELADSTTSWRTHGQVAITELAIAKSPVGDVSLNWEKPLDARELSANLVASRDSIESSLVFELNDAPRSTIAASELAGYRASLRINDFRTRYVLSDIPTGELTASLTGSLNVRGNREDWIGAGTADLERIELVFLDQKIELQTAVLSISPDEYRLQQFRLVDSRGRIAGSGVFRRNQSGFHQLNLRIANVELKPYASRVLTGDLQSLSGEVALETRLTKQASAANLFTAWNGTYTGSLSDLAFRGSPIGQITASGQMADAVANFKIDGPLLGGQATFTGTLPIESLFNLQNEVTKTTTATHRSGQQLQLQGTLADFNIRRLVSLFADRTQAARYDGTATMTLAASGSSSESLELKSQLSIAAILYDRLPILSEFTCQVAYRAGWLNVEELRTRAAGGRVTARGSIFVGGIGQQNSNPQGELRFDAQRIQLNEVMAWLAPDLANEFDGSLTYSGSIRLDRQLRFSGYARAMQSQLFGLTVEELRSNLSLSLRPDGSLQHLRAPNIHGNAIGGTFVGEVDLRGGSRLALVGRGRIREGRIDRLSKALGFEHIVGSGRFNGDFDLQSRDVVSLAALSGRVQVDFKQGDVQSIPVLSDIGRYLPIVQLASTDISAGTMHALIGQGQLRIQDLLLDSDAFWLAAEGSASLTGGRMDIDAILQTGGSLEQQLSESVAQKLTVIAVPQAAIIAEIDDLIRNRAIYFHIGGTTHHPVLQPRPAQTIGAAILQNVRQQLLATPALPTNN